MDIRQQQKLSQRMALTPQMKQSLQLLQLPLIELKDYLQTQIEENPVFEHVKEKNETEEILSQEKINKLFELSGKDSQVSHYNSPEQPMQEMQDKQRYRENSITKGLCLHDHLSGQLRLVKLSRYDYLIAEAIISDIDENGYLRSSIEELSSELKKNDYLKEAKIGKKEIEKMLSLVQTFDPAGIAARNLKECLLSQIKRKNHQHSLAVELINNYLADIAKNKISYLSKMLKRTETEIKAAIRTISLLEPKPGRAYDNQAPVEAKSAIPDVIIENNEGKLEIIVNTRWLPTLSISKQYKKLLQSDNASDNVKKYLAQKIKSATWLIKALSQRDETIRKIAESILTKQSEFLNSGDFSHLKPLTLKQIAKQIGRNESTVSRVVSSKYIRTPVGTYKLNTFFSAHLPTRQGENISTEHIKSLIHEIVQDEEPAKPLRDSAIAKILHAKGLSIARRTIAKYREELHIPAYHQRKRT